MKNDTRIVCGARCVWWGSIQEVDHIDELPCCPHCGSVLFEYPNEKAWFEAVDKYEKQGNPGYRAMIEWTRGKCFKSFLEAKAKYLEQRDAQ